MTKEFYFIVYEEESEDYCQVVKKSDNLERIKEYAELIRHTRRNLIAIIRGVFIELDYIEDLKEEDFENLKDEIEYEKERIERLKEIYKRVKNENIHIPPRHGKNSPRFALYPQREALLGRKGQRKRKPR